MGTSLFQWVLWLCLHHYARSDSVLMYNHRVRHILPCSSRSRTPRRGSTACLEHCQYSYDQQLRRINECPSIRIDMSGYSCPLEEVIRCLSVSNERQRYVLVHRVLMDDETLESAGKVAKTLGFSFFTAACRFAKWKPDLNKLQRSWMLLAVCSGGFFLAQTFYVTRRWLCFMSAEHDGVMEPIYQCRY